jgi:hypothetical protein
MKDASKIRKAKLRFREAVREMRLQGLWCGGKESTSGCGKTNAEAKSPIKSGENEA